MNGGLLLDTHSLLWLEGGLPLRRPALVSVKEAAADRSLFVSHISLWELGVAQGKKRADRRPYLRGLTPDAWLKQASLRFNLRPLIISANIASEAGRVPAIYGSGDPGDCFLIATARIRRLTLVTRDAKMLQLGTEDPGYLQVLEC